VRSWWGRSLTWEGSKSGVEPDGLHRCGGSASSHVSTLVFSEHDLTLNERVDHGAARNCRSFSICLSIVL
jgi:hypothetical protein